MLNEDIKFTVDKAKCIKCGFCSEDCPINIVEMDDYPKMIEGKLECFKCGHCYAVCPTGAISLFENDPAECDIDFNVSYDELKKLIYARRSVRKYKDENVDKNLIKDMCEATLYAPTAKNMMNTVLSVIDDKEAMKEFVPKIYEKLSKVEITDPSQAFLKLIVEKWSSEKKDKLFAGAPHMIVASAPKGSINIVSDPVIMLSYFEMLAVSKGLGTLWNGIMTRVLNMFLDEVKDYLQIPDGYQVGYVMVFGYPDVQYKRTVKRDVGNLRLIGG